MVTLGRRELLSCGAWLAAAAAIRVCGTRSEASASGAPPQAVTVNGSFISEARGGVETNWFITRPAGQDQPLHPVIALHWRTGNAAEVMSIGVPKQLTRVVADDAPPFAVVSVDGGDTYWHKRNAGGDSGAMVLDELLPMLESHHLDTSKVGFMGWSMGGYGALLLGARLGYPRCAAISATSPAVWPKDDYLAAAFDSPADWDENTVWGLPALGSIPIRVDCGTEDALLPTVKRYVAQLQPPPSGEFTLGGHDQTYWAGQIAAELKWLSTYVSQ